MLTWAVTQEVDTVSHQEAYGRFEARADVLVDRFQSRIKQALLTSEDLRQIYVNSTNVNDAQFSYLISNFSSLNKHRKIIAFLVRDKNARADGFRVQHAWYAKGMVGEGTILDEINAFPESDLLVSGLVRTGSSIAIPLAEHVFKEFDGSGLILLASGFAKGNLEGVSFQILDGKSLFNDLTSGSRFAGLGLQISSVIPIPNGEELELATSISDYDDMSEDGDYLITVHSIKLGTQTWNTVSWSTEEFFVVDHLRIQIALFVCVILTALITYIVWSQIERTRRVSSIVDRRTRALKKVNDELGEHYEVLQELNADLYKARESAEAASRAKSEFLATMSHELRTPLNAILGFSQILKDQVVGPLGDERYVEYSSDIHASGSHLLGLINDILDLAKLEANQLKIEKHEIYATDLIDSVKSLITPKFKEKDVALNLSLSDDMPDMIVGDDLRLKQIIINLVSNAVKFTDEGSIDVKLYQKPLDDKERQSGYVIEVSDTGIGIAEDKQSLLFQRFTQIDAALTRKHGGVGLGLAICHELTTLMGGKISVESEIGVGTKFFVHLPLEECHAADTDDDMII